MSINPALITTIRVGQLPLDALLLTSKLPLENNDILYHITGQALVNFINVNSSRYQFEIIDLWVSQAYIDTNFDISGLGILLMSGVAICNGQNGTPNLGGLVSVGYGTNYPVMKAVGGSKDAAVIDHRHELFTTDAESGASSDIGTTNKVARRMTGSGGQDYRLQPSSTGADATVGLSSAKGVTGTNKNMQPYMVLLKIMKL